MSYENENELDNEEVDGDFEDAEEADDEADIEDELDIDEDDIEVNDIEEKFDENDIENEEPPKHHSPPP